MTPLRLSVFLAACAVTAVAAGQAPQEPPRFRVAVDIVSIDAVVTDRNGDVVRDLTAADFEVFQDGKRQKVTFAQFVPVAAPAAAPSPRSTAAPASAAGGAPPLPTQPITREQVQRTLVIVVDDLGLSFEGIRNVRRALHGFVDTGLLPTDLTAIMRTGEARSLVQPLTTDRAALHAAIDGLRYNTLSRKGVSGLPDINQVGGTAPQFVDVGGTRELASTMGALAALTLVVQSARDLPGRRAVIFASEGFTLGPPDALPIPPGDRVFFTTRVREAVDRVIDQATRAGVVIYTVDGQGLQASGPRASDDIHMTEWGRDPMASPDRQAMQTMVGGMEGLRRRSLIGEQESLAYLSGQTGGFGVLNSNDLGAGLNRISSDVRDYYVLGYQPDAQTFVVPKSNRVPVHTIEVKVRRDGARVRTRKQFIGVSDPERSSAPATAAQQLVRAAISPFSDTTIAVHATNLPAFAPARGLFVRTALHLDARALEFSPGVNGTRTATVDLVVVVYNSDGVQVDNLATGFDVTLEDAGVEQLLKDGLVYTGRVPIKTPGGYQLRFAVRDRRSGAIGSAGAFVEVPDVTGGAFALSGLVLRAGDDPAANERLDSDRFSVRPTEALRVYAAGTELSYSYEVYNPGKSVQAVASLWRGADKLMSLAPVTLTTPAGGAQFATGGSLTLAGDLPAGPYMLQIAATTDDPREPKKPRAAVRWLSFEVTPGAPAATSESQRRR